MCVKSLVTEYYFALSSRECRVCSDLYDPLFPQVVPRFIYGCYLREQSGSATVLKLLEISVCTLVMISLFVTVSFSKLRAVF